MTPRVFAGLWIAAIIAVFAAGVAYFANNRFAPSDEAGTPLMPEIVANAEEIAGIEVARADGNLKLELKDGKWTIASRNGYPADIKKVRDLVVALGQMRTLERKTANPEKYALLNLDDPAKEGSAASQVTFVKKDGSPLTAIVLGTVKSGLLGGSGDATYVRLPGEKQTWLASGKAFASINTGDWVDATVYKLIPQEISKIVVAHADGTTVSLVREGNEYTVLETSDTLKLKDQQALKYEISDYAVMELIDVRKAREGLTPVATGTVETGATKLTVDVFKDDSGSWVSVKSEGDNDEAKAIAARTEGWQFKIPENKAKGLLKTLVNFERQ